MARSRDSIRRTQRRRGRRRRDRSIKTRAGLIKRDMACVHDVKRRHRVHWDSAWGGYVRSNVPMIGVAEATAGSGNREHRQTEFRRRTGRPGGLPCGPRSVISNLDFSFSGMTPSRRFTLNVYERIRVTRVINVT